LDPDEVRLEDILQAAAQSNNSPIGYFLEVDLEFPEAEHDNQNDYPFAPERVQMKKLKISEKQVTLQRAYDMSRNNNNYKLLGTLLPKRKYLLHFWNLKFYLEHGVKLVHIHRIIKFRQQMFIKNFIDMNTKLRANAKNVEEKDTIKKTVNCLYGKSCENLKKRTDVQLVVEEEKARKLIAKPHCTLVRIFEKSLVGIELRKVANIMDKPTFIGFAVL
jgi:hypothetical protein